MKLARREKYIVSLAALSITLIFLVEFAALPFFEKKERLEQGIRAKEKGLEKIVMLSAEYNAYQRGSRGIEELLSRRKKGFTLFSFLEQSAGAAKIKTHIKYMKPSVSKVKGPHEESMVEMKLEEISLEQLVRYLYQIESPEHVVNIKRLSIKENKKTAGTLDATLQVLTLI